MTRIVLLLLFSTSCTHITPLAEPDHRSLNTRSGELIYTGTVSARGTQELIFIYDRSVLMKSELMESSHTTYAPDRSEILLRQSATHTEDYRLVSFAEIQKQTGMVSRASVNEGVVIFTRQFGTKSTTKTKTLKHPPVVGPTLFGFVREHWQTIMKRPIRVEFLSPERESTFEFELALIEKTATSTRFSFAPTGRLIKMFVSDMEIEFDSERNPIAYHGLIPPKDSRLNSIEGSVQYQMKSHYR